jgi:hypothetical protein
MRWGTTYLVLVLKTRWCAVSRLSAVCNMVWPPGACQSTVRSLAWSMAVQRFATFPAHTSFAAEPLFSAQLHAEALNRQDWFVRPHVNLAADITRFALKMLKRQLALATVGSNVADVVNTTVEPSRRSTSCVTSRYNGVINICACFWAPGAHCERSILRNLSAANLHRVNMCSPTGCLQRRSLYFRFKSAPAESAWHPLCNGWAFPGHPQPQAPLPRGACGHNTGHACVYI